MKNKRFIVFAFNNYYPLGLFEDAFGSFDTKEESLSFIEYNKELDEFDNIEVYDRIGDELIKVR